MMAKNTKHRSKHAVELYRLHQSFPTFFDAFLPLLSLELFFPPLWNVYSSLVRVRRLVLTTIGAMVFIDENNIINQKKNKTKTICCQIMAQTYKYKLIASATGNLKKVKQWREKKESNEKVT